MLEWFYLPPEGTTRNDWLRLVLACDRVRGWFNRIPSIFD
jgi:hypothetical protein